MTSKHIHGKRYIGATDVVDKDAESHDFLIILEAMLISCRVGSDFLFGRAVGLFSRIDGSIGTVLTSKPFKLHRAMSFLLDFATDRWTHEKSSPQLRVIPSS
jgi:hypothetical protein